MSHKFTTKFEKLLKTQETKAIKDVIIYVGEKSDLKNFI